MNYDKCDPRSCAYPSRSARGLTKRELFAAMVFAAACTPREGDNDMGGWNFAAIAKDSVRGADALIAALNAEPNP